VSQRKQRVEHGLRDVLTELIAQDVRDPRVRAATLITVTRLELNVDLSVAAVYVSIIGSDAVADGVIAGLAKAAGFLRGPAGGHREPDDLVDQRQRLLAIAAGDRHAELAAPPRVLDVRRADLVDKHADPVPHAVLDPPDDHALVLQRAGISEQQADPGHADVHNFTLPRVLQACQGSPAT